MDRSEVVFTSDGLNCAGWLYRPTRSDGDVPCVVMAHGLSLTRHDGLSSYAEARAGAGAAVLVYDHRHLGDSGGQPRQLVRPSAQLRDRRAAIAYESLITLPFDRPITKARKVVCPVLLQRGERDISAPASAIEKFARRAPRAELKRYDLDHFQPFYGEQPTRVAADQAEWLQRTVIAP